MKTTNAKKIANGIRANANDYHEGKIAYDDFKTRAIAFWDEARRLNAYKQVDAVLRASR
jgi:hypothetical protein